MPYRFQHGDKTIGAAIGRIAAERLSGAAESLRSDPPERAVHQARKAVKKTRALLRLVRHGHIGFGKRNRELRDLGRRLAPLREAHVGDPLLDDLAAEAGLSQADRAALAVPEPLLAKDPALICAEAARDFDALARKARELDLSGEALDVVTEGLALSLTAGAESMGPALECAAPELLHGFRKRVKDRWYHARLLRAAWPEAMAVEIAAAGALAEMLGDHQDLAGIAARTSGLPAAAVLSPVIEARQAKLLSRIAPLALRLYSEPPVATARRWIGWWQTAAPSLPNR